MSEKASASTSPDASPTSLDRIQTLLNAKSDTSRFVGLTVLKSVLDSSEALRNDQEAVATLWKSVPPIFLDRLLRIQQGNGGPRNAKDMLDLAVSVLHTFTALLLPDDRDTNLFGRIPRLVSCL